MTWLGWMALAPALGLPELATAAMINRDVASGENPNYWVGWLILLLGLAAAVVVYLVVTSRLRRPRVWLGLLYGLVLWLVAGALVMPLLAWGAPDAPPPPPLPPGTPPPPQAPDPMHASFMMLDLSNWAPVGAAIAWLLFGAVLGAVSVWIARERT
jgi:drug/metabolite transporter (DMT)-like permease